MGYYGGSQGRLVSTLPGLKGVSQQGCDGPDTSTGLVDCGDWSTTTTLSTTTDWPTGVYWLHLVRDDNGADNAILLVVRRRRPRRRRALRVPTATYQAYNPYGGKSLYDCNSNGATTVSGHHARGEGLLRPTLRADLQRPARLLRLRRPVERLRSSSATATTSTTSTSTDLHTNGGQVATTRRSSRPPTTSTGRRRCAPRSTAARDSGTGLFWLGSNQVYWRIRFESSPSTGAANRVEACYKTTQSGATDPRQRRPAPGATRPAPTRPRTRSSARCTSATTTTRLPARRLGRPGPHARLAPHAARVDDRRVHRRWAPRSSAGSGTTASRTASSRPARRPSRPRRSTASSSRATAAATCPASATATGTLYKAASGAWVVSTGTNYWSRGLANNAFGSGDLDTNVQQATVNVLADMNAKPATPASGIVQDQAGAPAVTSTSPAAGATGVPIGATVKATFDRALDPTTVTAQTVTLTPAGGAAVAATVTYDDATQSRHGQADRGAGPVPVLHVAPQGRRGRRGELVGAAGRGRDERLHHRRRHPAAGRPRRARPTAPPASRAPRRSRRRSTGRWTRPP